MNQKQRNVAAKLREEDRMDAKKKEEEKKEYKNPVLFMRKSAKGEHLYAFNVDKADGTGSVLGSEVGSLLLNVSEVVKLLDGTLAWIKVSVLPPNEGE